LISKLISKVDQILLNFDLTSEIAPWYSRLSDIKISKSRSVDKKNRVGIGIRIYTSGPNLKSEC
jgi:hypothetical protein